MKNILIQLFFGEITIVIIRYVIFDAPIFRWNDLIILSAVAFVTSLPGKTFINKFLEKYK